MNGNGLPLSFTRQSFERALVGETLQAEAAAGASFAPLSPYSEAFQQTTAAPVTVAPAGAAALVVVPTQDPVRLYGGNEGLQLLGGPAWMPDAPIVDRDPVVAGVSEGTTARDWIPWLMVAGLVVSVIALMRQGD